MFIPDKDQAAKVIAAIANDTHSTINLTAATAKACGIIQQYMGPNFCVGHSGGKDSNVVHYLANIELGLNLPVAHTSKTQGFNAIHPDTLAHLYARPFPIELYPEGTDFPYTGQIDGTRADEAERLEKSNDLIVNGETVNRKYMKPYNVSGLFGMKFIYPIFDWNDAMVWAFHLRYNVPFSDEYEQEHEIMRRAKGLL
jgi:3'-phosphoadenosine 5'-phosphosulfate sulfotransferase (PAPS reductase)/FAD synthetase